MSSGNDLGGFVDVSSTCLFVSQALLSFLFFLLFSFFLFPFSWLLNWIPQ